MNFTLAILLAVTAAYGLALIMWEVGLYPSNWVALSLALHPLSLESGCTMATLMGLSCYCAF